MTQPSRPSRRDPIAIIGIGCRFPGGIGDPESYWRALREGLDAITEIPADRFDAEALYREGGPAPGRIGTRWGGFLEQIDRFDAAFFGISPREADLLDPQQRLLLETSWEAFEDAGQPTDALLGSRAGVFVGLWLNDYEGRLFADPAVDFYMTTGSGRYAASGRISYTLGLQGPSVTIDTACSSSLVAVHLACQSLWSGECPLALAGGANVILQPHITIAYSQSGMMAADGRCKFGDARANGYVRSEGAAMLVLKPLAQALADGDRVYATIRGSAVNNDGRSGDYLATPAQAGQEQMLRLAYRDAGVSPGEVAYVEAHGTGTGAGDPVELGALGAVLAEDRPAGRPCAVGSVKTNLGHTEGAAGVAGLIKAALALHHREIPPTLHLEQPNPAIPWERLPLFIPREPTPLATIDAPLIAGVSSFGIAGTNAHMVLEEYGREEESGTREESNHRSGERGARSEVAEEQRSGGAEERVVPASSFILHPSSFPAERPHLLPLSARSPEALRKVAERWVERFSGADAPALEDLAYTASRRRSHLEHRLAVVAQNREELLERLRGFAAGEPEPGTANGQRRAGEPKVVFVFPGQGSQWPGMGRELLAQEPVFRQALEECDAAMRPFVEWSLLEQLTLEEDSPGYLFGRIDVVQPTLVSLDIALAELWRSWGIEPAAVVGHSMGEVAAACVSGALSLPDAMRVICLRSQLLRRISGQGAMAVVELPREATEAALAGHEERVSVAASNSPRSTILAGEPAALQAVLDVLERQGVFCRMVNVDVASHSPQVDPLRDDLLAALAGIEPRAPAVPFHSTVLNRPVEGAELDPGYWARNLRQPVLFSEAVQRLLGEGHEVFVEVSPHPVLLPAVQQTLQHAGSDALALGSLRRGEPERATLLGTLGELYVAGCPVDWQRLHPEGRLVTLPAYPWQRERFWYEAPARRAVRGSAGFAHPLLGDVVRSATGHQVWEGEIGITLAPYLADHQVYGQAVLPAAAYLELGLAATGTSGSEVVLEDIHFEEPILPGTDDTPAPRVQQVVEPEAGGAATLQVFSRAADAADGAWVRAARGRVPNVGAGPSPANESAAGVRGRPSPATEVAAETAPSPPARAEPLPGARLQSAKADFVPSLQRIRSPGGASTPGSEHYHAMAQRGLEYGPSFRVIEELWSEEGRLAARLRLPEAVREDAEEYRVHPVVLDGCLQLLLQTLGEDDPSGAHLPVAVRRLRLHRRPEPNASLLARAVRHPDADGLHGDVFLYDGEGNPVLSAKGVRFRHLPSERTEGLADWMYAVEWQRQPLSGSAPASDAAGVWLLLADRGGVAETVAARLEGAGGACVVVQPGDGYCALGERRFAVHPERVEDFRRMLGEVVVDDRPLRGVIHLWSLDAAPSETATPDELEAAQAAGCVGVLHLVQALVGPSPPDPLSRMRERGKASLSEPGVRAPRLWLVTRGTQAVETAQDLPGAVHAPIWGMAGVLRNEHPELRCACVDLDDAASPAELLAAELFADGAEDRVALRGGERYVARLGRHREPAPAAPEPAEPVARRIPTPYAVETSGAGVLDNLRVRPAPRRRPGPGEVEIEVRAVGLNFMNVMSALGTYPGYPGGLGPLGIECAGVVTTVGEEVAHLAVGDEVVAFAFDCLATHALADSRLVAAKPPNLGFEQAATVPIAFLTASYALEHLGRLAAGERVLIHSATGGVGLAAIQLARRAGAEVLATAGSEEKRAYLRSLGVRDVFDSRSLAFAEEVLAATGGEGVDLVLNSLAGEAIAKGLSVLRPYGRFLELGKRDIHEDSRVGLGAFRKQLAYHAIDLDHGARARPALLGGILRRIMAAVEAGELTPLPERVFPVSEVADAFWHMARAQHIGKVVIALEAEVITSAPAGPVRPDATYLITGGLGALGLEVARWLAEEGARSLLLVGRSEPSAEARVAVTELESMGIRVVVERADVGREEELRRLLERIGGELPPLRGIVHAAGLLADATVLQLDRERLLEALAPKLRGAWNLHGLTRQQPLDFFVLFSSVSALLGIPGQANYAAANAFLDALAHARRARGLPALSIGWGPWSELGLAAARSERGKRLDHLGLGSLNPAQGIEALGELLRHPQPAHLVVARLNANRWSAAHPAAAASPFLSPLRETATEQLATATRGSGVREAALAVPAGREREAFLEAHLRTRAAAVLRLSPERLALSQPLKALGMDSLMTLELRNRLEADLGIPLSATLIWNYPTITLLARHLAGQLSTATDGMDGDGRTSAAGRSDAAAAASGAVDDSRFVELGREEIESLLENELAAIDDLLGGS